MNKKALISVYNKDGIIDFAKGLIDLGWDLISTGGSYNLLKKEGIAVSEVSDITEYPEIFDGRVKTLHPKIHGGILARNHKENDIKTMKEMDIERIDMVVNNLYPFEDMLNKQASLDEMIENIDIGGPSMIRAAAKNYRDVIVVTDIKDYKEVLSRLKNQSFDLSYRQALAGKAFSTSAYYDSLIANYFNKINKVDKPEKLVQSFRKKEDLRYGENPHQEASYYIESSILERDRLNLKQLHGKQISYNNMNDLYGAIKNLKEFDRPTVVAVKHTNPSGIGSGDTIDEAFNKAYESDKISIFGGIIVMNRKLTKSIAEIINSMFIEIVLAPEFEEEALSILKRKKNIRIIESSNINDYKFKNTKTKETINGVLLQDEDKTLYEDFKIVSKRKPSKEELEDLIFGLKAVKTVNSNGVVLVKKEATIGYGFGEVRRSWAVEKAIERAEKKINGCVLASDGFFFEDTVELLKENNIKAAISPGGSIKDNKVIELCDKYGIALIFTSTRHFKH